MTGSPSPRGELTLRTLAMPGDANPAGDIFGGWVMAQMDLASGIRAAEQARGRVVTVAVKEMAFVSPVKIGDTLSIYTEIESIGRTSITLHIEAWAHRSRYNEQERSQRPPSLWWRSTKQAIRSPSPTPRVFLPRSGHASRFPAARCSPCHIASPGLQSSIAEKRTVFP